MLKLYYLFCVILSSDILSFVMILFFLLSVVNVKCIKPIEGYNVAADYGHKPLQPDHSRWLL